MALLILRLTVGLTMIVYGGFSGTENAPVLLRSISLLAVIAGVLLVIGLLTPLIGALVCGGGIIAAISPPEPLTFSVLQLCYLYIVVTSLTVVLLGPGAFSLDARVFGRREIIIPEYSNRPK